MRILDPLADEIRHRWRFHVRDWLLAHSLCEVGRHHPTRGWERDDSSAGVWYEFTMCLHCGKRLGPRRKFPVILHVRHGSSRRILQPNVDDMPVDQLRCPMCGEPVTPLPAPTTTDDGPDDA